MKKIKFTVLHPAGTNVDLMKDEGQIPYTLAKLGNFDTKLVMCNMDKKETCFNDKKSSIRVQYFPKIINNTLTGVLYLLLNSKKIDWLNIYFAGRQAYLWMRLYKALNPKGHVYLKLDLDFRSCDLYDTNKNEREIFRKNTVIADIISAESEAVKKRIQKYSSKEILIIEDGIAKLKFTPRTNEKREDIFLTVGRLGTRQKATDILLEAFEKSSGYHDWKLKLIGNVEDDFKTYIDAFYEKYPSMQHRVEFVGSIKERERLYSQYCQSKVFVMPSRWESFGIAAAEALCCGCHVILSDSIPPAIEMTNDGKYGEIVKTEEIDSLKLAYINAANKNYEQYEIDEIVEYANRQFSWERICGNLVREMDRVMEKENEI